MRKQMFWWLLLVAPLAVGISSAQTILPTHGRDTRPVTNGSWNQVSWDWCRYYADNSSRCFRWWASNFRDGATGEIGSQLQLDEIYTDADPYKPYSFRMLNCNFPGQTIVRDGPNDTISVAVSVEAATYCWEWGYYWEPDPDTGGNRQVPWPFPETLDLDATASGADTHMQSKSLGQTVTHSTGEKATGHCNWEARLDFADGGFTLFGTYRRIGPWTFADGGYRTSAAIFETSKCTEISQ